MKYYLAYGSNLHPQRLQARVASARPVDTVRLPGWALAFHKRSHDGSAKCNIIETGNRQDVVYAAIFTIARQEKAILDHHEGLGRGYHEQIFHLPNYGNVFCYRAAAEYIDEQLSPYSWYKRLVVLGSRYHRFPETYIDAIEATPAVDDPDPLRHATNYRIIDND